MFVKILKLSIVFADFKDEEVFARSGIQLPIERKTRLLLVEYSVTSVMKDSALSYASFSVTLEVLFCIRFNAILSFVERTSVDVVSTLLFSIDSNPMFSFSLQENRGSRENNVNK